MLIIFVCRLVIDHRRKNQTNSTRTSTFTYIPMTIWKHFTWTYSKKTEQSHFYLDGARQQSIDFKVMNLDFQSK